MPSKKQIINKINEIEKELIKVKSWAFEHYAIDSQQVTDNQNRMQKSSSDGSQKTVDNQFVSSTFSALDGIFDVIEDALTLFYMKKGLTKLKDIPFNTFEASLFIEDYIKKNFERKKQMYKELGLKQENKLGAITKDELFGKQENKSKGFNCLICNVPISEYGFCNKHSTHNLIHKDRIQDLCEQEKKQ